MPKYALQLKAQLDKVTNLRLVCEDTRWDMKLCCTSCGECTPDFVYFTNSDKHPMPGGKGETSLLIKCKFCRRDNSVDLLSDSFPSYNEEHSGKFTTIAEFNFRGLSPEEFSPAEWYDYDERARDDVSITEVVFKFVKL